MPKRSDSHQIRDQGYDRFAALIHDKGWIIRNKQDQDDYGVDCEVELVNEGSVTGTIVFCQVKGAKALKWDSDVERVSVTSEQWNYWFNMSIPVVLILADVEKGEVFWTTPFRFPPKTGCESASIKFNRENLLEPSCESLQFYVLSWKKGFSNEAVLSQSPMFHKTFVDLLEFSDWCPDPFYYHLEPDQDMRFSFFYEHVIQLRLVLGLHQRVLPLHFWHRRSKGVSSDYTDERIIFEVFKEGLLYVRKFYEEAVAEIKKRFSKSGSHENFALYFEDVTDIGKASEQSSFVTYQDEVDRCKDPKFHATLEMIMDQISPAIKQFTFRVPEKK